MPDHSRFASTGLLLLCAACAGTQGEEVRDARMERIDANAEAQRENIGERQDARAERIDQQYEQRQERIESSNVPAEDANETLVEIQKQRAQYESQTTARLNKLAARINAAQQKIDVLGPRAPLQLKTSLDTAAKQYDLLKTDVMKLDSTPPSDWDATKQDVENRLSKLDERVSQLDASIQDV